MSQVELDRAEVVSRIIDRRLRQREAAKMLGLTTRQVRRLCRAYQAEGPGGLRSKRRGQLSNRRLPASLRSQTLDLVRRLYTGFGPTLAHEKLREVHGFTLSLETLRKWMTAEGLWTPRARREARVQQPRRRRSCLGELIQIDGCDHDWFEERASRCVLLVFIDDATGRLMELRFTDSESTFEYFKCMRRYLERHGRPVALYSDKASIFRVNRKEHAGTGLTQFGRAMTELNIDVICANTASAKGRVERVHQTLQDRLVKELRLAKVNSIEDANAFLDAYVEDFNARFGRAPRSEHDAHRPLIDAVCLDDVFSLQDQRKLSRSLTLNYKRVMYVLDPTDEARALRGRRVQIYEDADGQVSIRHGALHLAARPFDKDGHRAKIRPGDIVNNKLLDAALLQIWEQQQAREKAHSKNARTRRQRRMSAKRLAATGTQGE